MRSQGHAAGFLVGGGVSFGGEIPLSEHVYISAAAELLGVVEALEGQVTGPFMVSPDVKGLAGGACAGVGASF
jgi:hypothetical protein